MTVSDRTIVARVIARRSHTIKKSLTCSYMSHADPHCKRMLATELASSAFHRYFSYSVIRDSRQSVCPWRNNSHSSSNPATLLTSTVRGRWSLENHRTVARNLHCSAEEASNIVSIRLVYFQKPRGERSITRLSLRTNRPYLFPLK